MNRGRLLLLLPPLLGALVLAACVGTRHPAGASATVRAGEAVYRGECARCHGPRGEGVAGKYDEALHGEQSVDALARYIARTMPEDRPGTLAPEESRAVAEFIHGAFYAPTARARNHPARVEPARLTNRQYRESLADLLGSFRPVRHARTPGGLEAEYFQSKGMNKKEKSILQRRDRGIDFDFADGSPAAGITADQFSIAWAGSLLVRETGEYQFRLTTPNGARLYLNTDLAAGDANRRDDSDAKRQPALIDLWVSSGGQIREGAATLFLLGGRSYPLRVDYFKFKEKTAAVRLEWKPPHGVWSVIPASALSPEPSSAVAVIGTALPADDGSLGYERGSAVSKEWHAATTRAAIEASGWVADRLHALAGTRDSDTNRVARLREFCATFAARAFRRPLTPELRAVFVDGQFAPGLEPETAVKRAVLLILKSPRFLYPDLGGPTDDAGVAARLALTLWDSLPDAPLAEAAARGELRTREAVRAQAERLMADPRARAKLAEFFHHWLAFDEAEDLSKDPKAYPGFDGVLVGDLRESLERFVEEVVWSPASDYRELIQADYLYLNPRLARFYGVETPAGDDFVRVRFDPAQRAGIITHPFLLAALSYHRSSSPIHRGVFLTRNVLGRFLKPPPMAIEFMDDRFDPSLTMREKVTELTAKPACMGCHATINPLGFSLEHYDAAGRYRTIDNAKPVNARAEYTTPDGKTIALRGPRDLAEHTANSPEARAGFVRQLFHHAVKQSPAAYGPDTLARLDAGFAASGTHVRRLLVEIALTAARPLDEKPVAAHP